MSSLSDAMKEAYASAPNSEDALIYHTLEFQHPDFVDDQGNPDSGWVVQGFDDIDCLIEPEATVKPNQVVTFLAVAFKVIRPSEGTNSLPELELEIDGVGNYLTENLDRAVVSPHPIKVFYREYLEATRLSGPEVAFAAPFIISEIDESTFTLSAKASAEDVEGIRFPNYTYTLERFPGLI